MQTAGNVSSTQSHFPTDTKSGEGFRNQIDSSRESQVFLTPAGEYFYSHCKIVLEEMEELRRETIRIGQAEESRLRIGFLRCYGGQELHQACLSFSRLYPEISVDIILGNS